MPVVENKLLVQNVVDVFNRGDLDAVDRLFAPDYVDHDPSRAGAQPGSEGVKQAWAALRAAFPDLRVTIEDVVAEGDNVAVRSTSRGTHHGELMGISPTGKSVTIAVIDINRIVDGKLAERWAATDTLSVLQQLGAIPAPKPAGGEAPASRSTPPSPGRESSPDENMDLVRRFIAEIVNRGNLSIVDDLVAPDYAYHGSGMEVRGPDGIKGVFAMLRGAFPDWEETTDDLIAEGDRVVFRVTGRGTHQDEFFGIPATGKQVTMAGIDVVRVDAGKMAEHWAIFDQLGLFQQLGAIPAPGQPLG